MYLKSKSWGVQEDRKDSAQQSEVVWWEGRGVSCEQERTCWAKTLPGSSSVHAPAALIRAETLGGTAWNLQMAKGNVPS